MRSKNSYVYLEIEKKKFFNSKQRTENTEHWRHGFRDRISPHPVLDAAILARPTRVLPLKCISLDFYFGFKQYNHFWTIVRVRVVEESCSILAHSP